MLGAPVWACDQWGGLVYPNRTPRKDWLTWYSKAFNTVEGNSTFYALPDAATFQKWVDQTLDGFRFCFKFPRLISHDQQLSHCDEPLREFLGRLEILAKGERLGPTFLQLGPAFGPEGYERLERFLRSLPAEFSWAVELRHHDWFDSSVNENRVNDLLRRYQVDKVLFDSRPLFQSPPDDAIEAISQGKKPRTPVRQTVTADQPMLRIVGRNHVELADAFFMQWAPIVAAWIRDGQRPIIFTHAPNDAIAPTLAQRFMTALQSHLPDVDFTIPSLPTSAIQLSLLD